ncbi:MAG: recombinase family protein [Legionellales bacterium]|nr:recombinase family protein [Legionellales bacterium]
MLIGYARVSTADQSLALQEDALKQVGCKKIYSEVASGVKDDRVQLGEALKHCRAGDTFVVWKLDRLGRSLHHLIETVNSLNEKGIDFKSIQENIDTSTSGGTFAFHIFSAMAQFERDLIRERTQAGLLAARRRGRVGGRPRVLNDKQIELAKKLHADESNSIKDICEALTVKRATLYKYLKSARQPITPTEIEIIQKKLDVKPQKRKIVAEFRFIIRNNNKFVRGRKKAYENAELFAFDGHEVKKMDDGQYDVTIEYETESELYEALDYISHEIHASAESRHCFVDDMYILEQGTNRSLENELYDFFAEKRDITI